MERKPHELFSYLSLLIPCFLTSNSLFTNILCMSFDKHYELRFKTQVDKRHAFICGSVSGIIATAAVHPLDLLRTRMALRINDLNIYKTMITNIYYQEGLKAFFRGLKPNIFGIFLYKGISFYFYENLVKKFKETNFLTKSHSQQFWAAGLASISAQIMTYPFDVIKRRYMVINDHEKKWFHKFDQTYCDGSL